MVLALWLSGAKSSQAEGSLKLIKGINLLPNRCNGTLLTPEGVYQNSSDESSRDLNLVVPRKKVVSVRSSVEFPRQQSTGIIDLYHAREHVWKGANAVHGPGTPQGAAWAKQADDLLSHGKIEELVQMIEKLPDIPTTPDASRSVPQIEADYFRSNAERMRYPAFRAKGMHIGSGIAEAACKTVVSTRAKRSGMRWTPDGLDAILALRTSVLNQSYDSFWERPDQFLAA